MCMFYYILKASVNFKNFVHFTRSVQTVKCDLSSLSEFIILLLFLKKSVCF